MCGLLHCALQPCMAWVSDGNETETVLLKLKLKSPAITETEITYY
jgi:hypothetical protein